VCWPFQQIDTWLVPKIWEKKINALCVSQISKFCNNRPHLVWKKINIQTTLIYTLQKNVHKVNNERLNFEWFCHDTSIF
jgi:hypothetical protein